MSGYPTSKQFRAVEASLAVRPGGPVLEHPLVGRRVGYRAEHATARTELGTVTSVAAAGGAAFVRFDGDAGSKLCSCRNLRYEDTGLPVAIEPVRKKETAQ